MWHVSVCNTVQEPTVTSTTDVKKTTTWGESGFPSEFLDGGSNAGRLEGTQDWAACSGTACTGAARCGAGAGTNAGSRLP